MVTSIKFTIKPLLVLVFAAAANFAQPADYREIPISQSRTADAFRCQWKSGGYDRPPAFIEYYKKECEASVAALNIDYKKSRLLYWAAGSDCHMRVVTKLFRSDMEKRVRLVLNNIYGGCRAGGWRAGWVVIDKPPTGYKVSVEEVRVDRIHDINAGGSGFAFPPPPAIVTIENVPLRTVEFADCLPLTGQSQWMLSSDEHLTTALENKQNATECSEKFRKLNIDFSQHTLVGVSFASGYCGVPEGLELSMTKETSTHRNESKYVLKAVYDDTAKPCETFATYPVWVVTPKIGFFYGFEVDARPRSKAAQPRPNQIESPIEWIEKAENQINLPACQRG